MATLVRSDLVGVKEDVSNEITKLYREETTFISSIKTQTVDNTVYQWLEDSLGAPAKVAMADGHDAIDGIGDQPVIRDNVTQILADTIKVSRTSDRVSKYGREKEINRLVLKAGVKLRIALEHSAVGTGQEKVNGLTREFAGVQAMIAAGNKFAAEVGQAIGEEKFLDVMQALHNEGATPKILMTGAAGVREIAGWATSAGRTRDFGEGTTVVNVVDLLRTPFGQVRVSLNIRNKAGDTVVYDPKNWKLAVLDGWFKENLAKVGDSSRVMVAGEYGLIHTAFKSSALITAAA